MEVRTHISSSQAAELTDFLPNEEDRVLEGTVLEVTPDQLLLLVPVTTRDIPGRMETLSQRVEIPIDEIFEVEQRELDRWKTGLLSTAGALLTGYILYETLGEGGRSKTPGPGGPGPEDSVILFRIPIGG
jgi:hypothetical protein